jgi:AbrB family looped-hinge helix DNA binding protein
MSTAKITSKGQITIPKEVRARLGVISGDRVEFVEISEGVFQIVAATQDVKLLKGIVPKPKKPVTVEEMNQAILEMGESIDWN